MTLKRTPLFAMHEKYQGKLIDFGGWELPVQYEGIVKEHNMVRTSAGIFDVSHMGEIEVRGEKALDYVQYLVTNDARQLADNQVMYTMMCYPDGGIVDDLLVYRYSDDYFFLVVNASNSDKDFEWIRKNAFDGVEVKNLSSEYAQLAVQGPKAQEIVQKLVDIDLSEIKFFWFKEIKVAGIDCIVSRTGYTGEDGFEIYLANDDASHVWEEVIKAGGDDICPTGLGARDSLRFEAKLPLYGQEIDKDITPLEAKLGFFVKLNTDDFIAKDVLVKQKEEKPTRTTVEFVMTGRGIARSHYEVQKDGKKIGFVTSGMHAPSLGTNIGLALIDSEYAEMGAELDIMIRNKAVKAEIGKGLFYKKQTKSK